MKIGYARVSTKDQKLDVQKEFLINAGCEKIFFEKISGKKKDRPELIKMMEILREGDQIVISKLDRLGRSLGDLVSIVKEIEDRKANLQSLNDQIDTSNPMGKFMFHIMGALAQFEREIISERTREGLASAKQNGRKGGRPKGLNKQQIEKAKIIKSLFDQGKSIEYASKVIGVSRATAYRWLNTINFISPEAQ